MTPVLPSTSSPSTRRPLFIVLEGIDGSGTTTQLERLTRELRVRGREAVATREPSDGPIGKLLRSILVGQPESPASSGSQGFQRPVQRSIQRPMDGRAMALLFAADRRDHLAREIEPALDAGVDVVSDRYVLSSLAYQALEADRAWVELLAEGLRRPDLTILLDVPIAVAAERRRLAGRPTERYDADATLERVAANYRRLASLADRWGRTVVLDGTGSVERVEQEIRAQVDLLIATVTEAAFG